MREAVMQLLVDPYIIAVPSREGLDKSRVLEWAEHLVLWNYDFPRDEGRYLLSAAAYNAILTLKAFPFQPIVDELFKRYNVTEYSAKDVATNCCTNLAAMLFLEGECTEELLTDVVPLDSVFGDSRPASLRDWTGIHHYTSWLWPGFGCAESGESTSCRDIYRI
jgi:hypothetical protein